MEINTVPCFESADSEGVMYSKIPKLQFPVDTYGRTYLVQDVTYYSKSALYDSFKKWRDGGPPSSGRFKKKGTWEATLSTRTTKYAQAGKPIVGVEHVVNTKVYDKHVWGLKWSDSDISPPGVFPQYFKHVGEKRVAISAEDIPKETGLLTKEFRQANRGEPFTSPRVGAWTNPGPAAGPFTVLLTDGSKVTYSWYRFIDQPSFQQYQWSAEKKQKLQSFIEQIHKHWPIDRDYMAPPSRGELAMLDPALLVMPPKGMEVGYVPIVTRQEDALAKQRFKLTDLEGLAGTYCRNPVENDWHVGRITIEQRDAQGRPSVLRWRNRAGKSWQLFPDMDEGVLGTDEQNPYYSSSSKRTSVFYPEYEKNKDTGSSPRISGFRFQNQLYVRSPEPGN